MKKPLNLNLDFTDKDIELIKEEVEEELDERGYPEDTFSFISKHPEKNYEIHVVVSNRKLDSILR